MFGKKPHRVGVLGLGIIGSRVARVLRDKDCRVYVWNRTPREEPNFLATPADVAAHAETLQVFVKDGPAVLETIRALLPRLTPGHVVVVHATIHPDEAREAAALVAGTGAGFLDAPFTGSREAAKSGSLNYYIGGEPGVLEKVRPVLEKSAQSLLEVGTVGEASLLKVATNMVSAATVQILAETLTLLRAHGMEPEVFTSGLARNANRSKLLDMKIPVMQSRDYTPHFSVKNMSKDMGIALSLAKAAGLALPNLEATAASLRQGEKAGRGDLDFAAVIENLAEKDFARK
jgi:3-hydroxyisobutyrate dehydrogenase-like beta-hydroxyacid dehydrogenase